MVAFVVYVGLDLANPFIPGAFTFNPEDCVEAVHLQGPRATSTVVDIDRAQLVSSVAAEGTLARHVVRQSGLRDHRREPSQPLVIAHAGPPPPAPPSEDH